jgi:hypothetical protein
VYLSNQKLVKSKWLERRGHCPLRGKKKNKEIIFQQEVAASKEVNY